LGQTQTGFGGALINDVVPVPKSQIKFYPAVDTRIETRVPEWLAKQLD